MTEDETTALARAIMCWIQHHQDSLTEAERAIVPDFVDGDPVSTQHYLKQLVEKLPEWEGA